MFYESLQIAIVGQGDLQFVRSEPELDIGLRNFECKTGAVWLVDQIGLERLLFLYRIDFAFEVDCFFESDDKSITIGIKEGAKPASKTES